VALPLGCHDHSRDDQTLRFDASDRGVLIRIDPHRSATGAALPLGAALTGDLWFTHITHLFQRVWASTVVVTRLGCARCVAQSCERRAR
jgi:hypothetical protein